MENGCFAFSSPLWGLLAPFGGLGTTYDVHFGINGKHIIDFYYC